MEKDVAKYLASGGDIYQITDSCEQFWKKSLGVIRKMQFADDPIEEKLNKFAQIVNQVNAYVWLTYGFEKIYDDLLSEQVPKYVKSNSGDFIREISYASKKNTYAQMEESLLSSKNLKSIQENFGWLKSRDGFTSGFTLRELESLRKKLKAGVKMQPHIPKIPKPLEKLTKEAQELIYFRTMRGDARSSLIFTMRPILKEIAKKYQIPFNELRYYSVHDLISKNPKYYSPNGTFLFYRGEMVYTKNPFVKQGEQEISVVSGQIGHGGVARGIAKIITRTEDLKKINKGDIFVAQQTFPAFLMGLHKASAFVTDEGGITCHAAIIAREMKKPCIVGTKNATKILKDGDMVEVDADKGTVKKL
jgi:phosphohistidine swiveling domain-containing protein